MLLAELSVVRVELERLIQYRSSQLWSSTTRLGLRLAGSTLERPVRPQSGTTDTGLDRRFATRSCMHELTTSDPVRRLDARGRRRSAARSPRTPVSGEHPRSTCRPHRRHRGLDVREARHVTFARPRRASALETYTQRQQSHYACPRSASSVEPMQAPSAPTVFRASVEDDADPDLPRGDVRVRSVSPSFSRTRRRAVAMRDSGDDQVHRATGVEPRDRAVVSVDRPSAGDARASRSHRQLAVRRRDGVSSSLALVLPTLSVAGGCASCVVAARDRRRGDLAALLAQSATSAWPRLIAASILIILFIPIRRYTLPAQPALPARAVPRVRGPARARLAGLAARRLANAFRRTGFEGPLLLILASALASDRGESWTRRQRLERREQEPACSS